MTQHTLVVLEEVILKELEFNMHYAGPLPFLERFLRLFGLSETESPGKQINMGARQFLATCQRSEEFLKFKPSQCAAVALILAITISKSSLKQEIGITDHKEDLVCSP
jgi:hypothetical protein